jgi:hypothetical protein
MTAAAVARVASVARKEVRRLRIVTTSVAVATVLATLNRLSVLTNSHTNHRSHHSRTHHRNSIFDSRSIGGEGVARSISSSRVVRVERVASPQWSQRLGRDHQRFRVGQRGTYQCPAEHAWRSRAPP